jgi:hypothetical protein
MSDTNKDKDINANTTLLNEDKEKGEKGQVQNKKQKIKRDPIKVQHVVLNEDFYALTWNACRKNAWDPAKVENLKILKDSREHIEIKLTDSDDRNLIFGFLLFIAVVLLTVGVLLYESFLNDAYTDATWPIVILRITLVSFAQQKLKPEIFQGISLLRYTFKHESNFIHPTFAKFVAFCQTMIASLTFVAIFFFCCMADEALDLIMNFAGLAVISELDDWVGEQIMAEKLYLEYNDEKFKDAKILTANLNDRMGLFTKICLVSEDLEIVDDQNDAIIDNCLWGIITYLCDFIPYSLIPLLTLPTQVILVNLQKEGNKAHSKH